PRLPPPLRPYPHASQPVECKRQLCHASRAPIPRCQSQLYDATDSSLTHQIPRVSGMCAMKHPRDYTAHVPRSDWLSTSYRPSDRCRHTKTPAIAMITIPRLTMPLTGAYFPAP